MLTWFYNFNTYQLGMTIICFVCSLAISLIALYAARADDYRAMHDMNFYSSAKKSRRVAIIFSLVTMATFVFGWWAFALFLVLVVLYLVYKFLQWFAWLIKR